MAYAREAPEQNASKTRAEPYQNHRQGKGRKSDADQVVPAKSRLMNNCAEYSIIKIIFVNSEKLI